MPKNLVYPQKVLIAWGESISGNMQITDWLMKNEYPELAIFSSALRNDDKARAWLVNKGFTPLLALINGVEGDVQAIEWLVKNNFEALARTALAGDGDKKAIQWLLDQEQKELHYVASKIRVIKDDIQNDNDNHHKISF